MSRTTRVINYEQSFCEQIVYETVNADLAFIYYQNLDKSFAHEKMCHQNFWEIMIPHWLEDKEAQKQFLKKFTSPTCYNNRLNSAMGRDRKNTSEELGIYCAAHQMQQVEQAEFDSFFQEVDIETGEPIDVSSDSEEKVLPKTTDEGREMDYEYLGKWLVRQLTKSNPKKMKNLIKYSTSEIPICNYKKPKSVNREDAWRLYCDFVLQNDKLPTKEELYSIWLTLFPYQRAKNHVAINPKKAQQLEKKDAASFKSELSKRAHDWLKDLGISYVPPN